MKYHLDDLFQSINDIYYQYDEGKISAADAEKLAQRCSKAFITDGLVSDNVKTHLMLSLAFGRDIITSKQLTQLLTIYKEEL
jgi:hypothetical protein